MKVYGYNGENVLNENPTKYLHVPNAAACEYLKFKDQSFKLTWIWKKNLKMKVLPYCKTGAQQSKDNSVIAVAQIT